jgi:ribosomal protein S12 methylthiotransferase accessory factor
VPLGDGLVLVAAMATLRLEGGVARVVHDRLLPAVAAWPTRQALLDSLTDLPRGDIVRLLDRLIDAGLILELPAESDAEPPTWTELVAPRLEERQALATRAKGAVVTVIGASEAARGLIATLAATGVGTVVHADPYLAYTDDVAASELEPNDIERTSVMAPPSADRTTETLIQRSPVKLTREGIASLVTVSDMALTIVDPQLSAVRVWVNAASLEHNIPSLHASINGTHAHVGPLVLPGQGPCFLCWRMRAIACRDDFEVAMALEEALDAIRRTPDTANPVLPTLWPSVAGALGHEVLAVTLGAALPRLTGRVLHLDGLTATERLHPVLPRPDCPACGARDQSARVTPPLRDLLAASGATDFARIAATAVSPLCGLIRALDRVPKDIEEPEVPFIVRTELANSQFLAGSQAFVGCSGKGTSLLAARDSALGEALERYAALSWAPSRRMTATRTDLPGRSIHPAELVLFAPEQYASLPYAPYRDSTVLEWVPARSLAMGDDVWVPLLAAHLGYAVPDPSAFLFPATSNGFAAGPTGAAALLRALLEVIERDAFLIAWSHWLPGTRYHAATIADDETRLIAAAYARRGVSIDVHRLPTDTLATVMLAVGWSDMAPAAVVGLGADLDPLSAARRAVLEVAQVRPALRRRLRQPETAARMAELAADPSRVRELEDHDLLYADPGTATSGLAHLRTERAQEWREPSAPRRDDATALAELLPSVIEAAGDVLYLDVTPADVEQLDVRVARAIVPGFQPMHFGAAEARLGHERLRRVPMDIGLRDRPARLDELNLSPHPLA